MSKWRRLGTSGSVSLGVAIAVLVGCQTPQTIKTDSENKTALTGQSGAGMQNQAPEQSLREGDLPSEVAPVDLVPAMLISAEKGGVYVSPDGLLTATIPPGALSEDAEVRFVALDTSKQKNTAQRVAGMRFQMDIGKAYLKPGSRIMVAARADARFVPELKSMYTDFTAERYSLKQDDKGNWNIEMPVEGPRLESIPYDFVPEDPFKNSRRGIMTEGMAPIDSKSAANFKRDSRIEAFCDYAPPPPPQPMYNVVSEVRWISDHQKDADYLGSIGFHGDLASGDTGWPDGSKAAGNPSKPTVRFGNMGARNIPTSTHWVTLTPPQAAVPQVSQWESVKEESAKEFITFKKGEYRLALESSDSPSSTPSPTPTVSPTPEPTPTPSPTPTPKPTRTIGKDGYAPYSIETNNGRYSAIKLASGNWVGINSYQNVTTTIGTDTWTEVKFNLADGKILQFENPDWWVVVKRTNGVATEAKQIDVQGAPKFRGIFEERADAFTVGTNQTVRRGHEWNGHCHCNYVVHYDNIVHDTAPQPVRGRTSANPGRANNIARNGFTIGIQATYNYPNPQGNQNNLSNAVTMTVGANNPVAQLKLTKNSPLVQVTMNSPIVPFATGSTLVLETVVDGDDRIYRWPGNGSNTLSADFFVRLKNDDPASFQVKRAYIENLNLSATQLTLAALEKMTIQRNGVYPLSMTFEAQGAK